MQCQTDSSKAFSESYFEPGTQIVRNTVPGFNSHRHVNFTKEISPPSVVNDWKVCTEKQERKTASHSTTRSGNDKRPQLTKKAYSSPSLAVQKFEHFDILPKGYRNCEIYCSPKLSRKIVKENNCSVISGENVYKNQLVNHTFDKKSESKLDESCEIFRSPAIVREMVQENGVSSCDGNLYKKSFLSNRVNTATNQNFRLSTRFDGNEYEESLSAKRINAEGNDLVDGVFSNVGMCRLPSRQRARTVSDMRTPKPGTAWKQKGKLIFNSNNEVCRIQRPRLRSATVCLEYNFSRPKTETCSVLPNSPVRTVRDSNRASENPRYRAGTTAGDGMSIHGSKSQNAECAGFSQEEMNVIKGKFRQIGHSVLAIAVMKKMANK